MFSPRHAPLAYRTRKANRPLRQANRGAQFHHGLVEIPGPFRIHQLLGGPAQFTAACHPRYRFMPEVAGQHPLHITVYSRHRLAKRDAGHSRRGVYPNARQPAQRCGGSRNLSPALGHYRTRRLVQRTRPAVVAKPAPQRQNFGLVGLGQRGHRREPRHESRIVFDYHRDARLLQHRLRHPDRIRIARLPPGQVPRIFVEPLQQILAEFHVFLSYGH